MLLETVATAVVCNDGATAETCPTLPAHVSAASGGEYSTNSNAFVQCSSSVAGKTCATDGRCGLVLRPLLSLRAAMHARSDPCAIGVPSHCIYVCGGGDDGRFGVLAAMVDPLAACSSTWGANWASDTSSTDTQVFSFVQDHNKWGMTIAPYASIHHRDCALNSITMTRESVPTVRATHARRKPREPRPLPVV